MIKKSDDVNNENLLKMIKKHQIIHIKAPSAIGCSECNTKKRHTFHFLKKGQNNEKKKI